MKQTNASCTSTPLWRTSLTVVALAAATLASPAQADCQRYGDDDTLDNDDACWYLAAGLNYNYLHPDASNSSWRVTDEYDTGAEFAIGYRMSHHFYLEGSYANLGTAGLNSLNPLITSTERIDYKVPALWLQYRLYASDVMKSLDGELIGDDWDIFLRVGMSRMKNDSSSTILPYEAQTRNQYTLGVSLNWNPDDDWGLRLKLDSYDKDAVSLGISLMRNIGI